MLFEAHCFSCICAVCSNVGFQSNNSRLTLFIVCVPLLQRAVAFSSVLCQGFQCFFDLAADSLSLSLVVLYFYLVFTVLIFLFHFHIQLLSLFQPQQPLFGSSDDSQVKTWKCELCQPHLFRADLCIQQFFFSLHFCALHITNCTLIHYILLYFFASIGYYWCCCCYSTPPPPPCALVMNDSVSSLLSLPFLQPFEVFSLHFSGLVYEYIMGISHHLDHLTRNSA